MTMRFSTYGASMALLAGLVLAGCDGQPTGPAGTAEEEITAASAAAFIETAEARLAEIGVRYARTAWVKANFITADTNALEAAVDEEYTALAVDLASEAARFDALELDPVLRRKLTRLKGALTLPAPQEPALVSELAAIKSTLDSTYATGKVTIGGEVQTLGDLSDTLASSRDPEALLAAWEGWRTVSPSMKEDYARMVEIANAGAKDLGFENVGALWRGGYDMDADAFAAEVDRLWGQVKPLYDSLQCHVRHELSDYYGRRTMPDDGTIPAHLLGNMWAQQWGNIYDVVKPEGAGEGGGVDITPLLEDAGYDARRMAHTADDFFVSLGFDPLPETFWERSLFTKPADREVVCHASAWNIDSKDDVRIKMCTKVNGSDFVTVHHEVGHNIYQRAYKDQSPLHQSGANDGFHEAIGDMVALSITPGYLAEIGLLDSAPATGSDIPVLLRQALDKVAFLPFGLLVDKWRWQVFDGTLTPDTYNEGWWDLRREYQGISAPTDRPETAFDPGAKYHIPGNTPYMRYFLAHILQFQFHKAACDIAGHEGPLHTCSIYGNKDVGARFNAMLEMGASEPWPDALEAFTGTRTMDGSAIVAYFRPLKDWLDEQNEGRACGWD